MPLSDGDFQSGLHVLLHGPTRLPVHSPVSPQNARRQDSYTVPESAWHECQGADAMLNLYLQGKAASDIDGRKGHFVLMITTDTDHCALKSPLVPRAVPRGNCLAFSRHPRNSVPHLPTDGRIGFRGGDPEWVQCLPCTAGTTLGPHPSLPPSLPPSLWTSPADNFRLKTRTSAGHTC